MNEQDGRAAFQAALNNQYFVLQSTAGNTVAESSSRASLYVMALSSALVAFGFASRSSVALGVFLAVVLPTLFVLGVFTVVRLVDTGVQNVRTLEAMARIRRYYAGLSPEAPALFGAGHTSMHEALDTLTVGAPGDAARFDAWARRRGRLAGLSTIASMVAVVNSVVGASAVALLVARIAGGFEHAAGATIGIGVGAGLVLVAAFVVYQDRRYQALLPASGEGHDT